MVNSWLSELVPSLSGGEYHGQRGAGLESDSDGAGPMGTRTYDSKGLSTNLTYPPSWLRLPVSRSAAPFAVLPLRGPCVVWRSSSPPCCCPPMTSRPPLLSLVLPIGCYFLHPPPPPAFIMKYFKRQWTWKNCAVNTHIHNDLDSTINILLAFSCLSPCFHLPIHLSAYLILGMHFIVSGRHQHRSPLNIAYVGIN